MKNVSRRRYNYGNIFISSLHTASYSIYIFFYDIYILSINNMSINYTYIERIDHRAKAWFLFSIKLKAQLIMETC